MLKSKFAKFYCIAIFLAFAFFMLISGLTFAQVSVKGYYRKDGTYVRPHTRSSPKTGPSYKSDPNHPAKTVHVSSYTRKDGTVVRAYKRRPPGGGSDRDPENREKTIPESQYGRADKATISEKPVEEKTLESPSTPEKTSGRTWTDWSHAVYDVPPRTFYGRIEDEKPQKVEHPTMEKKSFYLPREWTVSKKPYNGTILWIEKNRVILKLESERQPIRPLIRDFSKEDQLLIEQYKKYFPENVKP